MTVWPRRIRLPVLHQGSGVNNVCGYSQTTWRLFLKFQRPTDSPNFKVNTLFMYVPLTNWSMNLTRHRRVTNPPYPIPCLAQLAHSFFARVFASGFGDHRTSSKRDSRTQRGTIGVASLMKRHRILLQIGAAHILRECWSQILEGGGI